MQSCCMVVPVIGVVVLAFFCIGQGQLPLTIVKHGYVSNRAAPRFMQTKEGCCPPVEESRSGTSVSYNVFLLSSIREPPPLVYWVALQTDPEPRSPNSLQVQEGFDGDGNSGAQHGYSVAQGVQAHYWLQVHGFPATAYQTLQQERLYHSFMPYNISIQINELTGPRYRIYFAAQNPETLALSSFPVRSEVFSTSMCARHCASCDLSGPGYCDRCNQGAFRTSDGKCVPCASHCYSCSGNISANSLSAKATHFFTSDGTRPCDLGQCHPGYTIDKQGYCNKCEVASCDSCDVESLDTCSRCQMGFGVAVENGTCIPCAHKHCSCSQAGGCDSCAAGWGLTESNATCVECDIGCLDCVFAHAASCKVCKPGFVMTNIASDDPDSSGMECMQCARHCANCSRSGAGSCDTCKSGFGYNADARECQSCAVAHCEGCADPRWGKCSKCEHGFGLTTEGICESCGSFCELCGQAGTCGSCTAGYALRDGSCWTCADMCASCEISGPARCDRCLPGFSFDPTSRSCLPPSLRAGTLEI